MNRPVIERALKIYDFIYKKNALKGMLVKAKQAVVIFYATKLEDQPRTIDEILKAIR